MDAEEDANASTTVTNVGEDGKYTTFASRSYRPELPDKFPLDDTKSLAVDDHLDYFRSMIKWMLRQGQGEALFSVGVDKKDACVGKCRCTG